MGTALLPLAATVAIRVRGWHATGGLGWKLSLVAVLTLGAFTVYGTVLVQNVPSPEKQASSEWLPTAREEVLNEAERLLPVLAVPRVLCPSKKVIVVLDGILLAVIVTVCPNVEGLEGVTVSVRLCPNTVPALRHTSARRRRIRDSSVAPLPMHTALRGAGGGNEDAARRRAILIDHPARLMGLGDTRKVSRLQMYSPK